MIILCGLYYTNTLTVSDKYDYILMPLNLLGISVLVYIFLGVGALSKIKAIILGFLIITIYTKTFISTTSSFFKVLSNMFPILTFLGASTVVALIIIGSLGLIYVLGIIYSTFSSINILISNLFSIVSIFIGLTLQAKTK
jgi:sensor histidine kinase YesM